MTDSEGSGLTDEILSEQVLPDVLKQRGQHRQQRHRRVVDDLRDALGLRPRVCELTLPQVVHGFLQIFRRVIEKRPQSRFDRVLAGFHHGSGRKMQHKMF